MNEPKPKRGKEYILNGQTLYLNNIRPDGLYLLCDSKSMGIMDTYTIHEKESLREAKKHLKCQVFKRPKISDEQKSQKEEMRAFFKSLEVPFNCSECGKPLYAYGEFAKRCVSAHILPKNSFESVKMCADNIVYLGCDLVAGVCNCHAFYDYSVENRVTMKIYPEIVERFKAKLRPQLTGKEIEDALDYLGLR